MRVNVAPPSVAIPSVSMGSIWMTLTADIGYGMPVTSSAAGRLGEEAMRRLRARSVCAVDPGLSEDELAGVERRYGFRFAADHRAFLAAGLPVNGALPPKEPGVYYAHPEPWPDWRAGDPARLREMLDRPTAGVLFDVERNGHWRDEWGECPGPRADRVTTARRLLAGVPTMVPVYAHRYLPAGAGTFGHPVLSMVQTDIIYYGLDLADYIDREFGARDDRWADDDWDPQATVEFWRDYL
jgi:hypothetical protein